MNIGYLRLCLSPPFAHAITADMQFVLDQHNMYRCMAGVDYLVWDDDIAANAQEHADAAEYGHSDSSARVINNDHLGENLAFGWPSQTGPDAVKSWYSEIAYTEPRGRETEFRSATGHYTALMWQNTIRLGCGRAIATVDGNTGDYTVCQYGPTGNWAGQFEAQVLPPILDITQCGGCPNDDPMLLPTGDGVAAGASCDGTACGGHLTKSCMACPQGDGEIGCSGDCVWNSDASQCAATPCAVGDSVSADYTDQPCAYRGDTYSCRRYAATIASISGESITVTWSDGETLNTVKRLSQVRKHGNTCGQANGVTPLVESTSSIPSLGQCPEDCGEGFAALVSQPEFCSGTLCTRDECCGALEDDYYFQNGVFRLRRFWVLVATVCSTIAP